MAARRTLSLEDAARLAQERGILDRDYYALHRDQTDDLRALFDRTRWRQSASSAAMGRSKLYSFHLALQRAAPRRDARRRSSPRRSSRDPQAPFTYSITYETWDEDAREAGETDDKGFEVKDEPATLRELLRVIERGGYNEPSVWPLTLENASRFWLTTSDPDPNYRTGEDTYRSIHIKGSERAMRRLVQVLLEENPRWSRDRDRSRARRRRR